MTAEMLKDIELRKIQLEKKAVTEQLNSINDSERRLARELSEMKALTLDKSLSEDSTEAEVNYVLGQSDGFVNGFNAAIETIVEALSSEYRDIPLTEAELYMLVDLGDMRRMARMKDEKSRSIAVKAGWCRDWKDLSMTWKREKENEND